jgi:hypothetical protein
MMTAVVVGKSENEVNTEKFYSNATDAETV